MCQVAFLKQYVKLRTEGPLLDAYLTVFAAKMGMALYREYCGAALPLEGGVQTQYFLNAGLAQRTAEAMLSRLPGLGTLKQGKLHAGAQFAYRFNYDACSIVAALIGFHSNFHIFIIATSTPSLFQIPFKVPNSDFVRPGELLARVPKTWPA